MAASSKIIGLIGGASAQSSLKYYERLIHLIPIATNNREFGKIVLYSVDFKDVVYGYEHEDWQKVQDVMFDAYQRVYAAGADVVAICSNTSHKAAAPILDKFKIPFIHIIEPVIEYLQQHNIKMVGLMGTKFTMKDAYYRDFLNKAGINVVIPPKEDCEKIHNIIIDEIARGDFETSRHYLQGLCKVYKELGAQAIILGCTELPLVLKQGDCDIPLLDTIELHVHKIIEYVYGVKLG